MEQSISISKQDAIAAFDGSVSALADALGITRSAVYLWRNDAPIPERQALRLRYEIRPDYFPPPQSARRERGYSHGRMT